MAIVKPDVIVISSDDDDSDGEGDFVKEVVKPDLVLISSDDDEIDVEGNLDKEEEKDVENSNEETCIDNCNDRSVPFNQGGNDLHALSLYECKTYLRKPGMRVSGTKEECIRRIKEHERLKDGRGESLYPKSSFSINCTGDACRGDVVLFKQNLYNSQRNIIEIRTVAGRIAHESYGTSTQQHTFSVEVLWSRPFEKLDPLSILLVKGRNLYKFGTFRQPWENEAERSKVLEEKHERGRAARHKRKLRETEFASGDNKGAKRRRVSYRLPSQSKHVNGLYKHTNVNMNTTAHNQAVLFQNEELKGSTQPTCYPYLNYSMYSDHHLQEASLPFPNDRTLLPNNLLPNNLLPVGSPGYSHHNNEQQAVGQTFSQSPDHHDHNSEPPVDRSKDETAKLRFPESSFSINCTGDARERDVVLFKQEVYMGRKSPKKRRTVAGRIVNVRQCEARYKHKFVIEVLWTIPSVSNPQRSTLLVRSHNLYKFGTFRQPWENEATRSRMFEEKHEPATRKRKLKKTDVAFLKKKGVKRQKVSHSGPSTSKQQTQVAKHKSFKKKGVSATPVKETKTGHKKKAAQLQKMKRKKLKQAFHLDPKPDMNLNPSLSINPDLITSTTSDPNLISSTTLNPNPISSITLNPNPISSTTLNPNPISSTTLNLNPISSTTLNPNPISRTILNPNPISSTTLNPNPISSTTLNPDPNPISSTTSNPNPNPSACLNLNPNARQTQNLNARPNQKKANSCQNKKKANPRQNKKKANPCQNQKKPNPSQNQKKPNPSQNQKNPNPSQNQKNPNPSQNQKNPNPHQNQKNPNPSQNQKNPNPSQNQKNPNPSQNQKNPNPSQNQKKPNPHQNQKKPNPHQNQQNPNPSQNQNPNPHQNQKYPNPHKKQKNPNPSQNPKNPNPHQNQKNPRQNQKKPNPRQNQKNPSQNPNPNPSQNPSQNPDPSQNPRQNLNPSQNPSPNSCQNPNPNLESNLCQNPNPNPNPCQDLNLNLNPNSFVYGAHQLQESSLSLPHDRTFIPNPPAPGVWSNQPPVWFPPNQAPFAPGYGGQWGSNHALIQPPDINCVAAQLLLLLWYQQVQ